MEQKHEINLSYDKKKKGADDIFGSLFDPDMTEAVYNDLEKLLKSVLVILRVCMLRPSLR